MSDGNPIQRSFARDRSRDALSPGMSPGIFTGVVTTNHIPNQIIKVRCDGQDTDVACVWAAGILSGLLGFKLSYLPPPKTRVIIYYTGQQYSYILGSYSGILADPNNTRGVTDHNDTALQDSKRYNSQQTDGMKMATESAPPVDLLEGEINIDNLMGVGLSLLRNLASLQAGDLAKVECHLLNDMVRIISQTFRHHSAFGDFQILNDGGKLNVEWNGSSLDHEAWGLRQPNDAKVKLQDHGDTVDMRDPIDGYNDDGRWRFTQYIGWLGDFINVFVTDPVNAIGKLAENQYRAGKARVHINNDGSIICQSVADIVLEKVVRIPVPNRLKRPEDPTGNRGSDSLRNQEQLKQWKPSDQDNLFEMAFQLREYARWLNNTHSLARFRQMDQDFQVPSEADTPAPQLHNDEQDKVDANYPQTGDNWQLGYACIRIYRDGSVQTVDIYGNSILTTKTGIQISSTQDILIQAAGSVNIVAGRDFNVVAQNNVNLSAVTQKLRLSAQTGIQCLVQSGKFLVDFIEAGLVFFKNSVFNINNAFSVSVAGSVNALNDVTALRVAAAQTNGAFGEQPHMFHIFQGIPSVTEDTEQFQFQTTYGDTQNYQTHAQSVLGRGERTASGTWAFSSNAIPGAGAPWPGSNSSERTTLGGTRLDAPSEDMVNTFPMSFTDSPMRMRTQQ